MGTPLRTARELLVAVVLLLAGVLKDYSSRPNGPRALSFAGAVVAVVAAVYRAVKIRGVRRRTRRAPAPST